MNRKPFADAQWIEAPWRGGPVTAAPVPVFHREFTLPAAPRRAVLRITALGLFEAEINGRPVCDHVFAPGWTDYRRRVRYLELEVAPLLRAGENALGVMLGDGWYCGHVATSLRQVYGDQPRLLAQLEWETAAGDAGRVETDSSWRCATGPIREADLLMGEACDARLEILGWSRPGLNTVEWHPRAAGRRRGARSSAPRGGSLAAMISASIWPAACASVSAARAASRS